MRTVDTIGGKQSPSNQAAANLQAPVNATPTNWCAEWTLNQKREVAREGGKERRKETKQKGSNAHRCRCEALVKLLHYLGLNLAKITLSLIKHYPVLTMKMMKLKLQINLGTFLPSDMKGSSTFVMGFKRVSIATASYSGRGCS